MKRFGKYLPLRIFQYGLQRAGIIVRGYYIMNLDIKSATNGFIMRSDEKYLIYDAVEDYQESFNCDRAKYERRIMNGSVLLCCYVNDVVAYTAWLTNKGLIIPKLTLNYSLDKSVYLYDAYTLPDFRGRGIHARMSLLRVITGFERYNAENGYLLVEKSNIYARNSLRKNQWVIRGVLIVIKFKSIQIVWLRN